MEDRTYRCIDTIIRNRNWDVYVCLRLYGFSSVCCWLSDGCAQYDMRTCMSECFLLSALYSIRHKYRLYYCCHLLWSKTLVECFVSGKYIHINTKRTMRVCGSRMYSYCMYTFYYCLHGRFISVCAFFVYRSFKKPPLCLSHIRFGSYSQSLSLSLSLSLLRTHNSCLSLQLITSGKVNGKKSICFLI